MNMNTAVGPELQLTQTKQNVLLQHVRHRDQATDHSADICL